MREYLPYFTHYKRSLGRGDSPQGRGEGRAGQGEKDLPSDCDNHSGLLSAGFNSHPGIVSGDADI